MLNYAWGLSYILPSQKRWNRITSCWITELYILLIITTSSLPYFIKDTNDGWHQKKFNSNPSQTFCITLRSKHPASFLCPTSLLHYCVSFSSGLLPWHSRGPRPSNSTLPIPPSMTNKRLEGTPSCRNIFGVYTWRDTVFIHIIFHSSFI